MASSRSLRKRDRLLNKSSSNSNLSSHSDSSSPPMVDFVSSRYRIISLVFAVFLISCILVTFGLSSNVWSNVKNDVVSPKIYSIEVVNEFHHDPHAFTQGLVYGGNDTLFESTGLYKQSSVRRVALQTGKVEVLQKMDNSYFGEGLTMIGKRLFQVTWLKETGFIYDRYNLSKFTKFTHQMKDGWGLATDGKVLFGSDGTSTLYKLDPRTIKVTDKHVVKFNGREVHNLNELEFVNGEVWANVWETDCIARISPKDGRMLGWILLSELRSKLLKAGNRGIDVLNGIAWDKEKNRIFVTGKLWPKLYEIKLHRSTSQYSSEHIEQMCVRSPHYFSRP